MIVPYTSKQRKFFNLCANNPEKAYGKCPSPADSKKLAHEANSMPVMREVKREHNKTMREKRRFY